MRTYTQESHDIPLGEFWESFWLQYRLGNWEPETRAQLEKYLSSGSLFLDIGAWAGPVTLWALDIGANVIAVEPDPVALLEFKKHIKDKNVELWEGALALYDGTISIAPKYEFGDTMSHIGNGDRAIEVPCWTIETILKGRVPDFVKMDVEGYEATLLPKVGPYFGELGVPMGISLHNVYPSSSWLKGYQSAKLTGYAVLEVR